MVLDIDILHRGDKEPEVLLIAFEAVDKDLHMMSDQFQWYVVKQRSPTVILDIVNDERRQAHESRWQVWPCKGSHELSKEVAELQRKLRDFFLKFDDLLEGEF